MPGERDDHAPGERRYWCRPGRRGDQVVFDAEETRHLRRVMRHRPGDRLRAIDGSGRLFEVELEATGGAEVRGRVLEVLEPAVPVGPEIWLGQALIRLARLEWLLEKGVEIGLAGFLPLITRHAGPVRQWSAARRLRLERIARAALSQSLGARLPILAAPRPLAELELAGFDAVFVAHGPGGPALPAIPSRGKLLLLVGPEGGFDAAEMADLVTGGAVRLGLGERRLRAETAALVGLTLLRWGGGGVRQAPPRQR